MQELFVLQRKQERPLPTEGGISIVVTKAVSRMADGLSRDAEVDGCERSDFPITCGSCLGDNPRLGMTKADYDQECKICTRPFTVFRWRPSLDARYRETEICQNCSKLKNVCQVCLLDLGHGLPVQVRHTALHINSNDAIPKIEVNREYAAEEHDCSSSLQSLLDNDVDLLCENYKDFCCITYCDYAFNLLSCGSMARAGMDYESSYGKVHPNDTILKLQSASPCYERNRAHVCSFFVCGQCTRGLECPYRHEMPVIGELSQQNIKDFYYGVNDPVAINLLSKAADVPSLEPPEDESIRSLYVGGLDARITEQDLTDHFSAQGEIESVKMVLQRACAFVTYTTREGAEKAAGGLANKLVIKGLRLKLLWGRPQALQQAAVPHSGLLPRAVILPHHNQPLHPPRTQDQSPAVPNFNILPLPQQERAFFSSMDPQRIGTLIPSQEGASSGPSGTGEDRSGSEKQQPEQHFPYPAMPPPEGKFYRPYYPPPYRYMPPPPPNQQNPPCQSSMAPPPSSSEQPTYQQKPPPGANQQ